MKKQRKSNNSPDSYAKYNAKRVRVANLSVTESESGEVLDDLAVCLAEHGSKKAALVHALRAEARRIRKKHK